MEYKEYQLDRWKTKMCQRATEMVNDTCVGPHGNIISENYFCTGCPYDKGA